jgi:hypothetical protein
LLSEQGMARRLRLLEIATVLTRVQAIKTDTCIDPYGHKK